MDAIYSLALLFALVLGGLGSLGAVAACWILLVNGPATQWLRAFCVVCGIGSLAFAATSALVHMVFGHGPATLEPMSPGAVLVFHKAYWVSLALALLSLAGSLVPARAARDRDGGLG